MKRTIPLAEILRPASLEHVVGQPHLFGEKGIITQIIAARQPLSILLWGPPGVGKTSIARLYAKAFSLNFVSLSGVFSGTADVKKIIKEAEEYPLLGGATLVFMDEIHRFNKAQQDAFLPYVENGAMILVGATTENPSFYLNGALLSRLRVLTLNPLDQAALQALIARYEEQFKPLAIDADARRFLVEISNGDGRYLYNMLENLSLAQSNTKLCIEEVKHILQKRSAHYDRAGDQHYDLISALHKSVRSSDVDAALYWFARMIEGGEDPLFLARRLIRMASEDIGLADPQALSLAVAGRDSYQVLGPPEGILALAQVLVYLALAPKSNGVYAAYNKAKELAKRTSHLAPPQHILNAPTALMRELGYGHGYVYDHDTKAGCSGARNFPDELSPVELYAPVERGFEREMKKRLEYYKRFRK